MAKNEEAPEIPSRFDEAMGGIKLLERKILSLGRSVVEAKERAETDSQKAELKGEELREAILAYQNEVMLGVSDFHPIYRAKMLTTIEDKGRARDKKSLTMYHEIAHEYSRVSDYLANKDTPTPAALIYFGGGSNFNVDATFFEIPAGSRGIEVEAELIAGEKLVVEHRLALPAKNTAFRFQSDLTPDDIEVGEKALDKVSTGRKVIVDPGNFKETGGYGMMGLGEKIIVHDGGSSYSRKLWDGRVYDSSFDHYNNVYGPVVIIGDTAVNWFLTVARRRLLGLSPSTSVDRNSPNSKAIRFLEGLGGTK